MESRRIAAFASIAFFGGVLHTVSAQVPISCERLAEVRLPHTALTLAETVAAGSFSAPEERFMTPPGTYKDLPAFCRVAGSIEPVKGSFIRFELWMPSEKWNGRFVGVGNGGFWGTIMYPRMVEPLSRGYAVASTDTGHRGAVDDGSFALDHPEKLTDYGYRAIHEMTVKSKAMLAARFGNGPSHSYWLGCSAGGRQGLMEAQRFPADYDGIAAGAPANDFVPLMASGVWAAQAKSGLAGPMPQEKFEAVHDAVLARCDQRDGVADTVLNDPRKCSFDPASLLCSNADRSNCLSASQVEFMKKLYRGPSNPRTGEQIFPGVEMGSELGILRNLGFQMYTNYWRQLVFDDTDWDALTFDFDEDFAKGDEFGTAVVAATDPDLSAFVRRGGKLFLWHGWNDSSIPPRSTVRYYEDVVARMGAQAIEDSVRLFMLPGVSHCGGGEGPDDVDWLSVLERWVEQGKTPRRVLAMRTIEGGERVRPLCPYPQVARYKGSGSTDEAASFDCVVH